MLALVRYEAGQLWRAPATWMLVAGCLVLGIAIGKEPIGPGMQNLDLLGSFRTQYFVACSSLLIPAMLMVFLPLSFQRDSAFNFESLIHAMPWQKRFWPKCTAVFLGTLTCLSLVPIGMVLGLGNGQTLGWGTWLFQNVIPPFVGVVAVNVVISLCLTIYVYYRWKSSFASYGSGLLLILLFWISQAITSMPLLGARPMVSADLWQGAGWLDSFGLSPFFHQTQYWTLAEKNKAAFPVTFAFIANRLFWLGVSAVCLWRSLTWLKLPLDAHSRSGQKAARALRKWVVVKAETPLTRRKNRGIWALLFMEARLLVKSWALRGSFLVWALFCGIGIFMVKGSFSESVSPRLPATSLILSYSGEPLLFFGSVLAVVFSAALLWRERNAGMSQLFDSLPVRNASLLLAKYIALVLVFASLVGVMVVVGCGYQLLVGYSPIDAKHWMLAFYAFGMPLLIRGSVIFLVQLALFGLRWPAVTAISASTGVAILLTLLPDFMHWQHPLLQAFTLPNLLRRHSELRGYASWGELFDVLALLWSIALVPLFLLAWRWWPRPDGRPNGWRWILALATATSLLTAGLVHRSYVASGAGNGQELLHARARYEKRYGHFSKQDAPQILHTSQTLDFFPEQKRLEVRATSLVENTTARDVDQLLITARTPLNQLEFNRTFAVVAQDSVLHAYLISFKPAWGRGEKLEFRYATSLVSHIFRIQPGLARKGAYFLQSEFEPVLGYYAGLEIQDPETRQILELPPKTFGRNDGHTRFGRFVQTKRTFDVEFSTSSEQTPLTSGNMSESSDRQGRRSARFTSSTPIYPVVGYFSGAYESYSFTAQGIPVNIYFHPDHVRNLATMEQAIRAAIQYCTQYFGAYAYDSLRVVEIPATFPTGGRASAGVVALSEDGLFLLDPQPSNSVNTLVRRTVHEVVHQWFGEKLVPKIANGEPILNESITKYVEAMVVERLLGQAMVAKMNQASTHRYFSGRGRDKKEPALVEANSAYLSYGKGGLVFQALKDLLGEEAFNGILHQFLQTHETGMTATMEDLAQRILASANEMQQPLIRDWLYQRVTYAFKLINAHLEQDGDTVWLVLDIQTQCFDSNENGQSIEKDLKVPLSIALWEKDLNETPDVPFVLKILEIQQPRGIYRIPIPRPIRYLKLNPMGTLLEANTQDNGFALKEKPGVIP